MYKILPFLAGLVFLGAIFNACSTNYPQWYLSSDEDDKYIYGVGDGENLNQAKTMALNDISSKVSVRIDSAVSVEQSQFDEKQSSKASAKIDLSTLEIQLDSVEYVMQEQIDGRFYIKARISKEKLIAQINGEINNVNIEINSILGDIKASKCATLSPQHKRTLVRLYNNALQKANQVYALDGKVNSQKTLDSVRKLVAQKPRAYYAPFASRGKQSEYTKINSGLQAEYKKFFSLESKSNDKFALENEYNISIGKDSKIQVTLNVNIKDCVGNSIFGESLVGKDTTSEGALNRVKAQLYKKLKAWQDS